jgi:hypothetical protein
VSFVSSLTGMLGISQNKYPHLSDLNYQLKAVAWLSLALFLFYLFFQPFNIESADFNLRLYYYAGFGLICFLFSTLSVLILPVLFKSRIILWKESNVFDYILSLSIWLFVSTATCFYNYFLWEISLSLDIVLKIILISLFPGLAFYILNHYRKLKLSLNKVPQESESSEIEIRKVVFMQSGNPEKMEFDPDEIMFLHSSNNYVEVHFVSGSEFKKELLRTTLKQISSTLDAYPEFIICHRTFIVNLNFVEKITGPPQSKKLVIKGSPDEIPISRQYLVTVKSAVEKY